MLDRGRQRHGGGDPYDAAGRRVVLTMAVAGVVLLVLLAMRVGYLAARVLGWPAWPVALGCAVLALCLPAATVWAIRRDR